LLLDLRSSLVKQQAADPALMCIALNNLGQLRYVQKRYGESVELYLDSLRIGQATFGEQHPTLSTLLSNLGMGYFKLGRLDDAEKFLQKASALCGQKLGEDHPACGEIVSNYSLVLRKLGRKHEANLLERRCQQIVQASRRRNGVDSTINVSDLVSRGK
jgi:tetratricopeptide (TPR) repeat protein